MLSFNIIIEVFQNTGHQVQFLIPVHFHDCIQNPEIIPDISRGSYKRLHIFGKTTAPITNTREQKSLTNPFIATDSTADHINISSEFFTKARDLIHERYLGCEE